MTSNLAKKFDLLQDRAQRRPIRAAALEVPGDATKTTNIGHLKQFYLQRLAKTEPNAAARLGAVQGAFGGGDVQPQANLQGAARPTFTSGMIKDIEDLEIMCNNCFNLIRSSEASSCTGDAKECPVACKNGNQLIPNEKPVGMIAVLDLKLQKLRAALEARLTDPNAKVNVIRHLTQLRYHIDTATKWSVGCSEIGALSDHTVQQMKQLTATSRVLAPAVYIFSKRVENVVVQRERELRKASASLQTGGTGNKDAESDNLSDRDDANSSVADVSSIVSELNSSCGTQYSETLVTQEGPGANDIGNVQDANDYLALKNEDEMRRWFYSQCLTVKLSCTDKTRARKTLISDLYAKVKEESVPIEGWVHWIRSQLMPEESAVPNNTIACTETGKQGQGQALTTPRIGSEFVDQTIPTMQNFPTVNSSGNLGGSQNGTASSNLGGNPGAKPNGNLSIPYESFQRRIRAQ